MTEQFFLQKYTHTFYIKDTITGFGYLILAPVEGVLYNHEWQL